jgi:hypothetical protein
MRLRRLARMEIRELADRGRQAGTRCKPDGLPENLAAYAPLSDIARRSRSRSSASEWGGDTERESAGSPRPYSRRFFAGASEGGPPRAGSWGTGGDPGRPRFSLRDASTCSAIARFLGNPVDWLILSPATAAPLEPARSPPPDPGRGSQGDLGAESTSVDGHAGPRLRRDRRRALRHLLRGSPELLAAGQPPRHRDQLGEQPGGRAAADLLVLGAGPLPRLGGADPRARRARIERRTEPRSAHRALHVALFLAERISPARRWGHSGVAVRSSTRRWRVGAGASRRRSRGARRRRLRRAVHLSATVEITFFPTLWRGSAAGACQGGGSCQR